jgi:hypothetical protein
MMNFQFKKQIYSFNRGIGPQATNWNQAGPNMNKPNNWNDQNKTVDDGVGMWGQTQKPGHWGDSWNGTKPKIPSTSGWTDTQDWTKKPNFGDMMNRQQPAMRARMIQQLTQLGFKVCS